MAGERLHQERDVCSEGCGLTFCARGISGRRRYRCIARELVSWLDAHGWAHDATPFERSRARVHDLGEGGNHSVVSLLRVCIPDAFVFT